MIAVLEGGPSDEREIGISDGKPLEFLIVLDPGEGHFEFDPDQLYPEVVLEPRSRYRLVSHAGEIAVYAYEGPG